MMNAQTIPYLLMDFDGPICSVFAGFPAGQVAENLRSHLRTAAPHRWMADVSDPHAVLRASIELGQDVAALAHRELAHLEVEAVKSATPTPFAAEVIRNAREAGNLVAVVSNNAEAAVREYLSTVNLLDEVKYISARSSEDPSLMKPNPHLVTRAISALSGNAERTALVGDQVSDVIAAHRAGVRAIGYANKEGKADEFRNASADLVITSMAELLLGDMASRSRDRRALLL